MGFSRGESTLSVVSVGGLVVITADMDDGSIARINLRPDMALDVAGLIISEADQATKQWVEHDTKEAE